MRLIVCASGGLGLQAIREIPRVDICHVFTDKASGGIQEFARSNGIPLNVGNPRRIADFAFLAAYRGAWLLSVNYLFIIDEAMIRAVEGRALNVHGSLLPKYRGRTPHVWAIINGESQAGVTVHRMSREVDEGDILLQQPVPISPGDTGGSLLAKYAEIYPVLIGHALSEIGRGSPVFVPQDHAKATYFPKRTEADGRIDWSWHRKRIVDWVRAQTDPYPGAFSIHPGTGSRIRIWECHEDESGFRAETPDGTILRIEGSALHVKCPNGIVRINRFEGEAGAGLRLA